MVGSSNRSRAFWAAKKSKSSSSSSSPFSYGASSSSSSPGDKAKDKVKSSPNQQRTITSFFQRPKRKQEEEEKADVVIVDADADADAGGGAVKKPKLDSCRENLKEFAAGQSDVTRSPSRRPTRPKSSLRDITSEGNVVRDKKGNSDDDDDNDNDGGDRVSSEAVTTKSYTGKPTPLEKQVLDLKQRHPGMLLFVECGYRYRFFGDDAEIAAKVLGINCHQDKMFLTASVPTFHGPGNYARKLVAQGHKVGVVSQTETAAAKKTGAGGGGSSGTFTRALTSVLTRTTFLGEDVNLALSEDMSGGGAGAGGNVKSMVLAVYEQAPKLALVAAQPSSGQILWDEFEVDAPRSELARRLEVIRPWEILVPAGALTSRTYATLKFYCDAAKEPIRVEEMDEERFNSPKENADLTSSSSSSSKLRQMLPDLPAAVGACFHGLASYLSEFLMDRALWQSENVERMSSKQTQMILPALTLRNLELFEVSSGKKGSKDVTLYSILNRTGTKPGARLLKDWMAVPLTDRDQLELRRNAVTYLVQPQSHLFESLRRGMFKMMDLEVVLMATLYEKVKPRDFLRMCQAMERLYKLAATSLAEAEEQEEELPDLLRDILCQLKTSFADSSSRLAQLDATAAKDDKMEALFSDWEFAPKVLEKRKEMAVLEEQLDEHRMEIKKALSLFKFDYATVSGLEYLVEVRLNMVRSVPKSWTKVNSTKQVARFRTPFTCQSLPKLQLLREKHVAECRAAWLAFVRQFSEDLFGRLQRGLGLLAKLDCLVAMADLSREDGFCLPTFCAENERRLDIVDGRNLVLERVLPPGKQLVPNDARLGGTESRALVLTGPNMGGKSSYIRQLASTAVLAQMGCYVPAASATLPLFDAIFVRTGAQDDMWARKSTLLVELEDAAIVLQNVTERSLVLLDEIGRGTSTNDGTALAKASLEYLAQSIGCLTVFVTHYKDLVSLETELGGGIVANGHMGYSTAAAVEGGSVRQSSEEADEGGEAEETLEKVSAEKEEKSILFLYKLQPGPSSSSFGLNVAKMAGVPEVIVDMAGVITGKIEAANAASSVRHRIESEDVI